MQQQQYQSNHRTGQSCIYVDTPQALVTIGIKPRNKLIANVGTMM
jgi:hypothetical protein